MTSIAIALLLVIPIALYARREWEFEQAWKKHAIRYMLENADLYDKLARQIARDKWHRYPEEKPKSRRNYCTLPVIIQSQSGVVWYADYDIEKDSFWRYGGQVCGVVRWRKLPEPPEEKK